MLLTALSVYLCIINIISLGQMGIDKSRAKKGLRRIREKVLFGTAAIGGSAGALVGMCLFRHKTRHTGFVIGMPAILAAHIAIAAAVIIRL